MRIAFVGKGGSGKTTLAALFIQIVKSNNVLLAIDADINMHLAEMLGLDKEKFVNRFLSDENSSQVIKKYLIGNNKRIESIGHFKKTTPPGNGSGLVRMDKDGWLVKKYGVGIGDNANLVVTGSYDEKGIGKSCYHNHLAVVENILSHLIDNDGVVVADMVAGVDAFANTMFSQFDLLVLCVEPTKKSLEVYSQYLKLAKQAKIEDRLVVIGNKVRDAEEKKFVLDNIESELLVGIVSESDYLRKHDRIGGALNIDLVEKENIVVLNGILDILIKKQISPRDRLQKLYDLHRIYVAQDYVKDRFGDLTDQIDPDFDINLYHEKMCG